MKGFLLGLVVAAFAFGGYLFWQQQQRAAKNAPVASAAPDAGASAKRAKPKKRRGARQVARTQAGANEEMAVEPEPEPIRLSAADLRSVAQGDDLSRPDVLRLDVGDERETRELSQDEIDARFRMQEEAILDCISRARPDPETYVPGRVTVKFRIQRAGTVRGVRVEGPAILQKGGLYGCIKGVVGRLRFPTSGSSQIVSYPFTLS